MIDIQRIRRTGGRVLHYVAVILVIFIVLFPFYIAFDTSIKPETESREFPRRFVTNDPTFKSYLRAFSCGELDEHMLVTAIVGGCTTLLSVGLGSLAAFSLSRFRFRGRQLLSKAVLLVYMFPSMLLVIPLFLVFARFRMNDSLFALIVTDTTFALPFSIWMLKTYFDSAPRELDDAALIDGCSPISVLYRVILPLSAPGLVATAVFCFMQAWGEYLFAFTLINTEKLQPITVAIYSLIGPYAMDPGLLMSASILSAIVPTVFFLAAQKWIVKGLTAGAVKG